MFRFKVFTDQHHSIATGHWTLSPTFGLGGGKRHSIMMIMKQLSFPSDLHLSSLGTIGEVPGRCRASRATTRIVCERNAKNHCI